MSLYDRLFGEAIGSRDFEGAVETASNAKLAGKQSTIYKHNDTTKPARFVVQVHGHPGKAGGHPGKDWHRVDFGGKSRMAKGTKAHPAQPEFARNTTAGVADKTKGIALKPAKKAPVIKFPAAASVRATAARQQVVSSLNSIANFYESVVQAPLSFPPDEPPRYRNAHRSAALMGLRHTGKDKKVVTRAIKALKSLKAGK